MKKRGTLPLHGRFLKKEKKKGKKREKKTRSIIARNKTSRQPHVLSRACGDSQTATHRALARRGLYSPSLRPTSVSIFSFLPHSSVEGLESPQSLRYLVTIECRKSKKRNKPRVTRTRRVRALSDTSQVSSTRRRPLCVVKMPRENSLRFTVGSRCSASTARAFDARRRRLGDFFSSFFKF